MLSDLFFDDQNPIQVQKILGALGRPLNYRAQNRELLFLTLVRIPMQ
jgi:hypothetical protein